MKKKINLSYYLPLFLFLLLAIGITCYSSTLLHITDCPSQDSYTYRYMGMLIAKGRMPYLDGFDNKGPIIYLLNYLGYLINKSYGVYFIEVFFIFLFYIFQYRISLLFSKGINAIVFTVASSTAFSVFYVGNMTEEYALPFLSLGLYAFLSYFLFACKNKINILLCGFGFGCIILLRPNMIMLWIVFCLYVIIHNIIKNKEIPFDLIRLFLLGFLSVTVPILLWLHVGGAINEYFKDCFIANFLYCNDRFSISLFVSSYFHFLFSSFMEIHLLILLFLIIKRVDMTFNLVYMLFMILNLGFVCMPGICFDNYAMIIIPSFIYPILAFWRYINMNFEKDLIKMYPMIWTMSCIVLAVFVFKNIFVCSKTLSSGNVFRYGDQLMLDYISEYVGENDELLVLGYKNLYYVESDRISPGRIFYKNCLAYPDGIEEERRIVNESLPKMLIVENGIDSYELFYNYDKYELIDSNYGVWVLND